MLYKIKSILFFILIFISNLFAETKKPNVLFVAVDDLNDWIGCFGGNDQVKTPHLDKFHEKGGMVMYNAHAPGTVCGPSRSALLTGVYPHNTGVYGNDTNLKNAPKAKDLVTLPEYFSENGYHSLSMGKIFHAHGRGKGKKTDLGQWAFDEFHNTLEGAGTASKDFPLNGLPLLEGDNSYHSRAFDWGPTVGDEKAMKDYKTAEWAAEQLQKRDFDKPFFMAIGFSKPHLQWYLPQKYFDMYPLDQIKLPKTLSNDLEDIRKHDGRSYARPHDTWTRVERAGLHKESVRAYMAAVTFVDECIGVLLEGLEQSQYADNTIVMLWGDHGWYLGEKQRYGKTQLWQEACRVPLMVKVPGVTQGKKTCNGVVNLIDMYPTLADLCDLPPNPKNDGRSFADLIQNPEMQWNYPTLTDSFYNAHRIYDGRYSYIKINNISEELYDHQKDPMEWNNLAYNPEYNEIKKRLQKHIPVNKERSSPRNQ